MILFKENCKIDILEAKTSGGDGRLLYVKVNMNGMQILLVNIYAPNEDNAEFFESIFSEISEMCIPQTIIGGDFNLVLDVNNDKYGGRHRTHNNAQTSVKKYMETLEIIDVWRVKHPTLKE